MIAKFDSYRKFETPMLYVCAPGCTYSNGMLTNTSGILIDVSDIEIIPNFNATSQLNFRCYKVKRDDTEANTHFFSLYNSLRNRRLIYAQDIGFFMITNVEDGYDGKVTYKDISAESCEAELRTKNIPYIEDGTYKFSTGNPSEPGMLEMLIKYSPLWMIGDVDSVVAERYRTFEEVDLTKNILGFMLDDLQDAYECIFVFDIINRVVSVYDQANYVHETNIHITKEDFINSLNVTESSDDLYTALAVTGDGDLSINAVNPIGTNVIYNFDYYLDWMSSGLKAKVQAWQDMVDGYSDSYYALQLSRFADLTSLSAKQSELDQLDTQLTMYKRCRENIVAEASDEDIAAYNSVIVSVGGVEIPENMGYLWVMYADDAYGTHITTDPYNKNYIGIAWDKRSNVASMNPSDYTWFLYRSGQSFPRTVGNSTKYTWVVFADSTMSGMSNNPDEKVYMGVSIDNESSTKSSSYSDYTWSLISKTGTGISEVLATILDMIDTTQTAYDAKYAEVSALNDGLETKAAQVSAIQASCSMAEFFTTSELEELSNYIIEGTYTDDYVTVTDNMTYAQIFEQMKTLYDRGVTQLHKVSYPTQEFTIDVENFIFVKEFEAWSEELETGCLINVEVDDNDIALLFLTSFEVNYEDKKLSMTFGNRYNRDDPKALFNKFLGNISKTANTLSYIRDTIYPIKSGQFNAMKEALETSRTLTKNSVLSSSNEQVTIDDTGYTGRRLLADGSIDPKQIKINGRNIVFTDDAWETCKTAIGEIVLGDGVTAYGINAEIIMGNIIYGNQLHIIDSNGNDMFQVTEDEIMIRVGDAYAKQEDTISGVDVMYCRANSSLVCNVSTITVDWSTVAPAWVSGEYVWQKTVTTYDDGSEVESAPTCLTGATGQNGRGISSSVVKYAVSQNGVNHPTNESDWSSAIPTYGEGDFLWTRTVITYTDNSTSISYSVSRDGINGDNNAVIYLYKRSATAVSIDWSNTLTYNFSTHSLSSVPSGWSTSVPSGIETLYMTAATAHSNTGTDTIPSTEWSAPVAIASNGINSATVFLYQRAANSSLITKPTSNLTYTFSSGTLSGSLGNWTQDIPSSDGNPCFVIQATATSISDTDTITKTEWGNIRELVSDGVGISGTEVTYKVSTSGSTPPSSGWSTTFPTTLQEGEYLWTRTVTSYTDGNTSTVYSVSRDGITGRGISGVANKYQVSTSSSTPPTTWQTSVPNLTTTNKYLWNYEIISYDDGTTSETEKRVIGVYGDQGIQGIGISSITEYYLASPLSSGVTTSTSGWTTTVQTVTATNKYLWNYEVVTYTNDNNFTSEPVIIGTFSNGIVSSTVVYTTSDSGTDAPSTGWQTSIPAVSEGRYLWTKHTITYSNGDTSTSYSVSRSPINGTNAAIVYLYKRASTQPSINWSNKLVYSFSQNKLTTLPSGWYDSIPSGTDPIYMTAATASSNTTSVQIDYTEWATPIMIAQNGDDGYNSAVVRLYQRAQSASSLTKPSGTLTYTFANGAISGSLGNWSRTIPATNGNPCFVIQAMAISTGSTDTISSSEWSDITKFIEDGANGSDGRGISNVVNYYAVSTSSSTAPTSWSTTVPTMTSTKKYLWNYEVISYDDGSANTETDKRIIGVYGDTGAAGKGISSIVEYYLASASSSGVTTSTSGWTTTVQTVTATKKYLWNYEVVNYTSGSPFTSTPVIIGMFSNGITSSSVQYATSSSGSVVPETGWSPTFPSSIQDGYYLWTCTTTEYYDGTASISYSVSHNATNGNNTAIVYLYKRSSSAATVNWTNSLTYNFTTKSLSSVPSGWSTSIPSGTNPIYVTAATASSNENTVSIAYTEWATPVVLAQNGSNGSKAATVFLYQRAADEFSVTAPATTLTYTFSSGTLSGTLGNWSQSIPTSNGNPCYVIQATAIGTGTTDTISSSEWSSVRKLVADGIDGTSGRGISNIVNYYAVSTSGSTAPTSWNATVPTLTTTNKYLWNYEVISYDDGSTPTETAKRVIGVYGDTGGTGNGISSITEYYLATASSTGVTTSTSGWTTTAQAVTSTKQYLWNYEVVEYTNGNSFTSTPVIIGMFSNSITSSTPSYNHSTNGKTPPTSGWQSSIPTLAEGEYLWTRCVTTYSDGTSSTVYSVSHNATNGLNNAIVYLYKRSSSAVFVDWNTTLTYNFSAKTLTSIPTGWSATVPSGSDPIYVTAATASSNTNTATIAYTAFSTPVILAQNGATGSSGSNAATVFLYQRSADVSSLTKPSGTLTYTFATGTISGTLGNWSQVMPSSNGNPCYVIQATAISTSATDTILSSEWSNITKLVEDGVDGNGITTAVVYYAVSSNGSTPPSASPPDGDWIDTFPSSLADGQYLWTCTVTTYSDSSTTRSYSVSRNGINGNHTAVVYLYKRSSSAPTVNWTSSLTYDFTTNSLRSTPSGWSATIPSGSNPIYMTAATASSSSTTDSIAYTEWATPVLIAQNGADGQPGSSGANSATVFLYQRASSSSGLTKPTTALTYTFATGVLSGTLGDWSQTIPSTDGNPCFVIQATAVNTAATDSIAASEWSDIKELVADGADGETGNGVETSTVTYAVSENGDTPPTTGWSDVFPGTVTEGHYLWTRTILTYTNGDTSISYSVSASGVGIESIEEEYYMSSSDTTLSDGAWTTTPPSWINGYYIWTRSHIYWTNGNETTTTPVLNKTLNELNATIGECTTEIEVNKQGIQQNTEYYNDLYGKVTKINAYIQTGVLSYDEDGRATYGVKIGENLSSTDAYIVSGATALSAGWLSASNGGTALAPSESVIYIVKTSGSYYGKSYKWNGSAYEEADSEGTLSSIFTSSELGFYDTGEKTAYFSNKYLNVRTVRTNRILLSSDVMTDTSTNNWQIGVDNGFYLKWIGST